MRSVCHDCAPHFWGKVLSQALKPIGLYLTEKMDFFAMSCRLRIRVVSNVVGLTD
jgi:hypothetical protein